MNVDILRVVYMIPKTHSVVCRNVVTNASIRMHSVSATSNILKS